MSAAREAWEPECPYCGLAASFFPNSARVYAGKNHGPVWACIPCKAWVGCHKGTSLPLGRLANGRLREAKVYAYEALEPVIREQLAVLRQENPSIRRQKATMMVMSRAAKALGIPFHSCKVNLLSLEQCNELTLLCQGGALSQP